MANPIKLSDLNQTKFYQLPKAFFHNPIYKQMRNESKIAYALLRDLLDLSIQNHWVNENNEVYVKLSRNKLMNYLNIKGTQKIVQIMKELTEKELIIEKQVGLKKCNEIYVCIPEELEIIYDDAELLEKDIAKCDVNVKENENGVLKIKSQEFRKSKVKSFENQKHIKTNNIKTNNIKTNNNNNNNITNTLSVENNKENVIVDRVDRVDRKEFNKLKSTLFVLLNTQLSDKDIQSIAIELKDQYKSIDTEVIENICNLIKNSNKEINNVTGYFISAIKNKYINTNYKSNSNNSNQYNKSNDLKFNNFDSREYDYNKLEKQLLGWE